VSMRTIHSAPQFRGVLVALSLIVAVAAASACGSGGGDGTDSRLVVATTSQIGAIVREVVGDSVDLKVLIGTGVNPHDYEPSAQDIREVADSAVVLRNGAGLDDFLDDALRGSGVKRIVTVTDGIELRRAGHDGEGDFDPHVWHDPTNVQVMVANVVAALVEAFPDHAATFRENGTAYDARLAEVDAEIRALIDTIPAANRKVVTAHDSLGYFLDRYGLDFVGAVIPSSTGGAETSAQELAALQDLIRQTGVRAIFAESSVDPSVATQLAADTGITVVTDLYGDSLGAPGSGADTIDGMLLHNARRITEALK
jgi:ABC-type Zn uptake system ZnuABC Zn-binding protein ZnuA